MNYEVEKNFSLKKNFKYFFRKRPLYKSIYILINNWLKVNFDYFLLITRFNLKVCNKIQIHASRPTGKQNSNGNGSKSKQGRRVGERGGEREKNSP